MANGGQARKNGNGANIGFEAELFQAADKLRGNLEMASRRGGEAGGWKMSHTWSGKA